MTKKFKKGEHVVYGINGVCLIEDIDIRRLSFDMPQGEYYILKPLASSMSTVFVPCDNEKLCSRMRRVMTKDEIDELLLSVRGKSIDWIEDRKERAAAYREILLRSDKTELLLLIRRLLMQSEELSKVKKKLSASDNEILISAEKTVRDEYAFSLGLCKDDVDCYIRSKIES